MVLTFMENNMKYSRLDRKKNPPTILMKSKGGLTDLFDNAIKETFIITDDEYDVLAEVMNHDELDLLLRETFTHSEGKKLFITFNKYLDIE